MSGLGKPETSNSGYGLRIENIKTKLWQDPAHTMNNEEPIPVPLYHGTSSLFLDDIYTFGLGGKDPIAEWNVLEFAQSLQPLVEEHLSREEDWMEAAQSLAFMVDQHCGGMNFQHGDTYLTPAKSTAVRYTAGKKYGSELLSLSLKLLGELLTRKVQDAAYSLYQRYPKIYEKFKIHATPILIRIDDLTSADLESERGGDPSHEIAQINKCYQNADYQRSLQQMNFRLKRPVPAADLSIWLINVTRPGYPEPEYTLYPIASTL